MNNLSWLLYLADVTGSLSAVLSTLAFCALLGGGIALLIGNTAMAGPVGSVYSWEDREAKQAWHDKVGDNLRVKGWAAFKLGLLAALIATVLPSKNTVYAIAASQVGETMLKSTTGGKAVKALDAWLDAQIDSHAAPKK